MSESDMQGNLTLVHFLINPTLVRYRTTVRPKLVLHHTKSVSNEVPLYFGDGRRATHRIKVGPPL